MAESCKTCRFSAGHVCRRYPPQLVVLTVQAPGDGYNSSAQHNFESKFPEVDRAQWCGEYRERG